MTAIDEMLTATPVEEDEKVTAMCILGLET